MKRTLIIKLISLVMILVCAFPLNALAETTVNVNSGAARTDSFISINKSLSGTAQGLSLIMCGLSKDNVNAMLAAVNNSYNPSEMTAIKYIDSSFVDAEKYNILPDPWADPPYDSNLCWAGSISNMMWMSGWAKGIANPYTSKTFLSEDDVFSFMNSRFVDGGSGTISGIEFYFTGMYLVAFPGSGHAMRCMVGDRSQYGFPDERDGLYKSLITSKLAWGVNLIGTTYRIQELEKICSGTDEDSVFQVSIGDLDAYDSDHSVTGIGLVIDPSATDYAARYKAIILANTDNDGEPTETSKATTDAEREASKASRPNSYTLYPLRLINKSNGSECWELVGYSDECTTVIYNLTGLKCKTSKVVADATEKDGTLDSIANVDLQLNYLSLTTEPTEVSRDYVVDQSTSAIVVNPSEPLYLNFHAQNHSDKELDDKYTSEKSVPVKYSIIRDNDSKVVISGNYDIDIPIYTQTYCNINLNKDGALKNLSAGEYNVRLEINPDRTIEEAYYDNNTVDYCKFKIESHGANTGDSNEVGIYLLLMLLAISLIPTLQGLQRQQR